jgi:hypothetical protein
MLATHHTGGRTRNQVPELHGIGRLVLMRHKFNSQFYYCLVLWEWKSIDVSWELFGWRLQGSHLQGMRWCDAGHTSRRWVHLGTKYRNCIGLAGRPSCAMNLIHDLLLSRVVGMEKYRCFLGTTCENCCSLNTQNVKDKHQSGVVQSPPGGGFKPRLSAT